MAFTRLWASVVAVLLVVGLVCGTGSAAAEPRLVATDQATLTEVENFLKREVTARGLPGIEFALVRGRSTLMLTAFGDADATGRPLTPHTPVLLASVSKNLTATAILQLVERGKVRLDTPVVAYLPWFRTSDPKLSATITVAQLLHHTSGLPAATPSESEGLDDHSPAALDRGVSRLGQVELLTRPGEAFRYSNANYNVLGAVVQAVSGEPFADYLERHVFAPAGMRDASVGPQPATTDAAAGFYPWFGGRFRATTVPHPGAMTPSAMCYASAADLAQVLVFNMNGGQIGATRLLTPASTTLLHRPAVAEDDFTAYAMGWRVRPAWEFHDPTARSPEATLPLLVQHDGSWSTTRTFLGFLPREKVGIAVLINANQPAIESELDSVYAGVWRILAGHPPRDFPPSEPILRRYGWQIALAAVLLLLAGAIWSVRLLRQLLPPRRARPRPAALALASLLVIDIAVAWLMWIYLPAAFETSTTAIVRYNRDVGVLLVVLALLSVGWGPVRTALGIVALIRGRRARPETSAPARSQRSAVPATTQPD